MAHDFDSFRTSRNTGDVFSMSNCWLKFLTFLGLCRFQFDGLKSPNGPAKSWHEIGREPRPSYHLKHSMPLESFKIEWSDSSNLSFLPSGNRSNLFSQFETRCEANRDCCYWMIRPLSSSCNAQKRVFVNHWFSMRAVAAGYLISNNTT